MSRRSLALAFSTFSLLACGNAGLEGTSAETPIVEVPAANPIEAPMPVAEEPEPSASTSSLESANTCITRARSGSEYPSSTREAPDGLLYAEALQYENGGRLNQARKGYLEVIQKYPQSVYLPLAFFAFGEMFLREAAQDPAKLMLAEQSFLESQKYRNSTNVLFAATFLRLADIYRRKDEHLRALAMLKGALDSLEENQNNPRSEEPAPACVGPIRQEARIWVVLEFAEVGRPDTAFSLFRRLSGDPEGQNQKAAWMCASLAEIYIAQNKAEQALPVLRAIPPGQYNAPFCPKEAWLIKKLDSLVSQSDWLTLKQEHARRCDRI